MGIGAAVGRVLMSKLARMFTSVSAIVSEARNLGHDWGYVNMVRDASFFKQAHGLENALAMFDTTRLITKNRMVETRFERDAAFRVYGISTMTDLQTGETTLSPASMYTNFRGTKNQYESEFILNYEFDRTSKYFGRFQITAFDTDLVVHNRKYGYAEYPELLEL
jgi:hypothetical protein